MHDTPSITYEFKKASHFTETKIYFKIDPKAANTALWSSKIWYHLFKMELKQTPKIMENQEVENKNRNNEFDSHEFIHFIADVIEPLYTS